MENDRNAANRLDEIQEIRIDVIASKSEKEGNSSSEELPARTTCLRRIKKTVDVNDVENTKEDGQPIYVPKWNSSSAAKPLLVDDSGSGDSSSSSSIDLSPADELPHFADEESIALHNEIKLLEQRWDKASRLAKSHKERTDIINDHLHSVRQEIDHTNSLVAAKKDEIDTEEHLASLSEREVGQFYRGCSKLNDNIASKQKSIKRTRSEITVAEDELEKLSTDLNWNQEELEQWAKAATKKDEENQAIQKYTLVDDLKIKELAMVIEDLTKLSVEKKSMLENEVTETRSSQTELDKLAERFKTRHDERKQLIQQWKYTIESMNNRDAAINAVATQYADVAQEETDYRESVKENREQYKSLQHEHDDSEKAIINKERSLRTKRQELSTLQAKQRSLADEINSLKSENAMLANNIESRQTEKKRALDGLEQAQDNAQVVTSQLAKIKQDLANVKDGAISNEREVEEIEALLTAREKELQQAEKQLISLKQKMYKDSQKLAALQQQEASLIVEVKGTQANIKNFVSKIYELELKRDRQSEILDAATVQLEQVEAKVARGLGVRSNEEQIQLKSRIDDLEKELDLEKQKKAELLQQQRKLNVELRSWNRKHDNAQLKYNETAQQIDGIGLEIFACEVSLKEIVSRKEETMVSRDVLLLDVRRKRDSLRDLLEELCSIEAKRKESKSSIQEKKDEAVKVNDAKRCELRTSKDDHHKTAMDLGKMKLELKRLVGRAKSPLEDSKEYESPELKLILAAQRREELQQEGDRLDEAIVKKEKEIRKMRQTLEHLKEMNAIARKTAKANENRTYNP